MLHNVDGRKRIELSTRDWQLIRYVEEQGFATQKQLRSKFFNSDSYCSERLKKLISFGYLSKKPIVDFFCAKREGSVKRAFFPHLLNLDISNQLNIFFINRTYSEGFGKSRKLYKHSLLLHQLILNDVRNYLETELIHKWILNDPKIKILSSIEAGRNKEIIPDLSIEYNSIKIAIELERTMKGNIRYWKRFNYFRDSIYSHVVYYYTDECQLKTLLKRAGHTKKFGFAHYRSPNEIYNAVWGILGLNEFIHKVNDHG